jgi:hypothetical protein
MNKRHVNVFYRLVVVFFFVVSVVTAGCGSGRTNYVTVEKVRNDSIYINHVSVDTIYQQDSVYVEHKADTVFYYKYKYLYKTKLLSDTIYMEKLDSIQVPYPVEKKLSRWQTLKLEVGGIALGVLLVVFVALVIFIIIRSRNKK